jgi:hypothetical protein
VPDRYLATLDAGRPGRPCQEFQPAAAGRRCLSAGAALRCHVNLASRRPGPGPMVMAQSEDVHGPAGKKAPPPHETLPAPSLQWPGRALRSRHRCRAPLRPYHRTHRKCDPGGVSASAIALCPARGRHRLQRPAARCCQASSDARHVMARLEVCAKTQALHPWFPGSSAWNASARLPSTRTSQHGVY